MTLRAPSYCSHTTTTLAVGPSATWGEVPDKGQRSTVSAPAHPDCGVARPDVIAYAVPLVPHGDGVARGVPGHLGLTPSSCRHTTTVFPAPRRRLVMLF